MKESNKKFTTGEVAKICNISNRTVQFYDKEGIITPSELSEGGRRIYNGSDLEKFRLACLYKALGFSLNEIKEVITSNKEHELLLNLLSAQQKKIEYRISGLTKTRNKISALQEEITQNGVASISNEEELNELLFKKEKHRKTDILTYIFMGSYIAIVITGFLLAIQTGGIYPIVMAGIAIVLLFGLIYYHSSVNAYICPNCGKKFTIGFFKDMFSLNGVKRGKYLKCPQCKQRAWICDTYKDE